jgi:hypothetical protein
MNRVSFRQHSGLAIAGLVAFFGAVPFASSRWYLVPVLLVPLAVAVWAWRSGTDADADGLTVRALLGRRRLPWDRVEAFVPQGRRVTAVLNGGTTLRLPAVTPSDVPSLLYAGGRKLKTRQ